jgi:hypothetical protein
VVTLRSQTIHKISNPSFQGPLWCGNNIWLNWLKTLI